jgi:hypothetical protein
MNGPVKDWLHGKPVSQEKGKAPMALQTALTPRERAQGFFDPLVERGLLDAIEDIS